MKVARSIAPFVLAVLCAASSGCWHRLELKALPVIHNPVVDVASNPAEPFMAGFSARVITPDTNVWMAGYNFMRRSNGVHDDLYARALVLKQGDEKLAMVSMDLVGLNLTDVEKMKAMVPGFRPDQIIIHCTHVHAGPDTMGLWGLPPFYSGRSEKYMEKLARETVRAIVEAEEAARPVNVWTAVFQMNPDLTYNMHPEEPKDDTMGIMVFKDKKGAVVAILINMTCHPEVMYQNNHKISSDFPGVVYQEVEKKYGGGAIYFNGPVGSLITPQVPDKEREDHDFSDVEWMGKEVAKEVDRGMGLLVKDKRPSIVHKQSLVLFPVENRIYKILQNSGMVEREVFEGLIVSTEVNLIEIGSAQFVTFPSEVYPKQGLNIRARQKPNSFQIALADDEMGYVLYPEDYGTERYSYESSLCPGPQLAVEIEKALVELLEE